MLGRLLTALNLWKSRACRPSDAPSTRAQFDDGGEFSHFSDTMEPGDQSRAASVRRTMPPLPHRRGNLFSRSVTEDE